MNTKASHSSLHHLLITSSEAPVKFIRAFFYSEISFSFFHIHNIILYISFQSNNRSFRAHLLPPLHETSTTRRETRKTTMMLPVRLLLLFNGRIVELARVSTGEIRSANSWRWTALFSFFSYTFSEKLTKLLPPRFWRQWRRRASRRLHLLEYKVVHTRRPVWETGLRSAPTRWSEICLQLSTKIKILTLWVVQKLRKIEDFIYRHLRCGSHRRSRIVAMAANRKRFHLYFLCNKLKHTFQSFSNKTA